MEANGFKRRIEKALEENQFLKILFQYPASDRTIVKRGYVEKTFNDSFDFKEIKDGLVTYSYDYIVEIINEPMEVMESILNTKEEKDGSFTKI